MNKSPIEWTNWTSNPIQAYADSKRGWFCEKVSPGCAHCYSSTQNEVARWGGNGLEFLPANRERVEFRLKEAELKEWSAVNRRTGQAKYTGRCFAFDMTDLFGEWVSDDWLFKIFEAIQAAPNLQFQILTKRPERAYEFITAQGGKGWPLPNLWLGVTVESQRWANKRIPWLLSTPAAVRFVSYEPALGPVDFTCISLLKGSTEFEPDVDQDALTGLIIQPDEYLPGKPHISWVIVGGESGSKHRAFDPAWARQTVIQCREAGVACFVKQLGGARPGNRLEDLPEDLRVREFPA